MEGGIVTNGTPVSFRQGLENFRTRRVILRGRGIGLGISKDRAIGGDDGNASAAGRHLRDPIAQGRQIFRVPGGDGGPQRRMRLGDAGDGGEFIEARSLIVRTEGALGEKIHGKKHADEECEKSEAEFPEKIKPHEFRIDNPRRARFSEKRDFQDRLRFFPASGGRTRPRCAESRNDPYPTQRRAIDPV
jgi:hypothetical protein